MHAYNTMPRTKQLIRSPCVTTSKKTFYSHGTGISRHTNFARIFCFFLLCVSTGFVDSSAGRPIMRNNAIR